VCVCVCVFFSFSFVSSRKAQIYVFQLGGVVVIVSFNGGCLAGFFKFSSSTLEPDLHNSIPFFKTRAPQPHSPSSSTLAPRSTG